MRSARAPILSIRSSTTAIAVASNAGATSIPGTRWRTAATSTACRARSRAREAKGVTLVASTSLYSVVCQVLKVSKCDLSRGLALFSTGTTRPDTPPSPDPARRLDVLCHRLRLAVDKHQAESRDIDTHTEHAGREDDIQRAVGACGRRQEIQHLPDLLLRPAGRELLDRSGIARNLASCPSQKAKGVINVVLHQYQRAAQFAQRVEIRHQRPVRVPVVRREPGRRRLQQRSGNGL